MAKIARKLARILGLNSSTDEISVFGSLAAGSPAFSTDPAVIQSLGNWLGGWFSGVEAGNSPTIEDMNAVCYVMSYQVAYIMQTGIPEWNTDTIYFIGSLVNSSGEIYKSIADNNTGNALTDVSKWVALFPSKFATLSVSNWFTRTEPEANPWTGITSGSDVYVAVASSGTSRVMRSVNGGVDWSAQTASQANSWQKVAYGAGLFAAISSDGTNRVMTSPDGLTWTNRTAASASTWKCLTFGGGQFVAIAAAASTAVMTSPDGITWTARTGLASAEGWNDITYGNGLYVVVGYKSGTPAQQIETSPDGITWTYRTSVDAQIWTCVAYGNGVFAAASGGNTIMRSTNGTSWSVVSAPSGVAGAAWSSMTFANGLFVAVASAGNQKRCMSSPDGLTWTSREIVSSVWTGVTAGLKNFVAISNANDPSIVSSLIMPD